MVEVEFPHGSLSAGRSRSSPAGLGPCSVGDPAFPPVGDGRPESAVSSVGEGIRTRLGARTRPTELFVLRACARPWLRQDRGWLLTHSTPVRVHMVHGRSTSHLKHCRVSYIQLSQRGGWMQPAFSFCFRHRAHALVTLLGGIVFLGSCACGTHAVAAEEVRSTRLRRCETSISRQGFPPVATVMSSSTVFLPPLRRGGPGPRWEKFPIWI